MKIVHELNQLDFGGVERVVRSIIKHDKRNEHSIIAHKDGPFRKKLEEVGAKISIVSDDDIEFVADLLHIHTGGGISGVAIDVGPTIPILETIHSPVRSQMPDHLITKRVGVSETVTNMNKDATTILNGIEIDELTFEADLIKSDNPLLRSIKENGEIVVGRVGRIGFDKGMEQFILACYYLQMRGYKVRPVIVGGEASDAQGYIGKLKLMCASLPVENVLWVGHSDNVAQWMDAFDIFLYPSETEGFGLVFAEAMLNRCAVVTYDVPVTRELFGGAVKLVDKRTGVGGLVNAVANLIGYPAMIEALANEGPSVVERDFDAERMSLEYQEIYNVTCNEYSNGKGEGQKTNVVLG